jgi:hypothetical protein
MLKFKSDDFDLFDISHLGEEDKKLHMLTQMNTKINRDFNDKIEVYVNRSNYIM